MKYKLTSITKECYGRTLHRIECVESFADVKVGDFGGWVESEDNLCNFGDAWVFGNAEVFDDAKVCGDRKSVV